VIDKAPLRYAVGFAQTEDWMFSASHFTAGVKWLWNWASPRSRWTIRLRRCSLTSFVHESATHKTNDGWLELRPRFDSALCYWPEVSE